MHRRRFLITLVILLSMLIGVTGTMKFAGAAAPATPFNPAAPAESSKITLGETTIDGPSLWTADTGSVRAVIAWTGTDTAHRLNLLSSGNGVTWGNKVTLNETSPFRASVARTGPNSGDSTVLAWTGSNANRSLNVLMGNPPSGYTKLTLWLDNSFTGPTIAVLNGALYLAWAGVDATHTLNVDRIVASGGTLTVAQKTTLWGWGTVTSPTIVADPNGNRLVMCWTGLDYQLHFATSPDGANWTQPSQSPMTETSDASPMVFSSPAANVSSNLQRYFVTWRGTDLGHSINVKYTTSYPMWPQSFEKAVLREQSLGGPVTGSVGTSGQLLLVWTGTDAAHHLNVASVSVAYPAACVPATGVQPVSAAPIWRMPTSAMQVSLTFDSDGGTPGNTETYLNILANHGIHASFFLTGEFAQANPALVQRIVSAGHDIGNHTVDHPDLANPVRTDAFVCDELTQADSIIASSAGHSSRPYFRPPYGSYNEQVQYLAAGLGYHTMLWTIDTGDWDSNTTTQDILNRVLNSPNLGPGAIILMHITSANEPYALDGVITGLEQKGYSIVPLSQLVK